MNPIKKLLAPLDKEGFAKAAQRALEQAMRRGGQVQEIVYDAPTFELRIGDERLFLGNLYAEYCLQPLTKRKDVIDKLVRIRSAENRPEISDFAAVKKRLLPRVRPRFHRTVAELETQLNGGKSFNQPLRLLGDDLVVEIAEDLPDAIRIPGQEQVAEWGVAFDDILKIAEDNLWSRSNEDFLCPYPGVYVSPWSDNHDASRMYLHGLIWQLQVKGEHVAVIPNRDVLIVTGSEDAEGLSKLAELAQHALALPRPLTGLPFILRQNKWSRFAPLESHPAHRAMRRLTIISEARDYEEQKSYLDAINLKNKRDLFVASYLVRPSSPVAADAAIDADAGLVSFAAWMDGLHTMMPQAEELIVGRHLPGETNPRLLGSIRWDRLTDSARKLLQPQDIYPSRYLTQNIPGDEELAAMGLTPLPSQEKR